VPGSAADPALHEESLRWASQVIETVAVLVEVSFARVGLPVRWHPAVVQVVTGPEVTVHVRLATLETSRHVVPEALLKVAVNFGSLPTLYVELSVESFTDRSVGVHRAVAGGFAESDGCGDVVSATPGWWAPAAGPFGDPPLHACAISSTMAITMMRMTPRRNQ
jgi:hypothetical protein